LLICSSIGKSEGCRFTASTIIHMLSTPT
jgi:hypothetical protein